MARGGVVSEAIHYPETDGKPMAESDFQRAVITYAVDGLSAHFQGRADVYVSGNLLVYYEAGNPRAAVAPDVFVVFGVPGHRRRTYRVWEEGKAPAFVLEVTSQSTRQEDQGGKRSLYAGLGVTEYWQYDPTGDYLRPRLQGFELIGGAYEALPSSRLPGGVLRLASRVLGLELRLDAAGGLRFYDAASGRALASFQEEVEARQAAEARVEVEAAARQVEAAARRAAEARAADLEARLRRLQSGQGSSCV